MPVSWLTTEEPLLKSSHFQEASAMLHTNTKADVILGKQLIPGILHVA